LKDAEAKPLTDEELERVISELYFEKVERIVKQNGKIKFKVGISEIVPFLQY